MIFLPFYKKNFWTQYKKNGIASREGFIIKIIGRFLEPGQVGGVVDSLKNSGINRHDMIISSFDEAKFKSMNADAIDNHISATVKTEQDDPGRLKSFLESLNELNHDSGIVVFVKAARHKAQEVKSVMEQSGAIEIKIDDDKD